MPISYPAGSVDLVTDARQWAMPAAAATAPSQLWARNHPIEKLNPAESRQRFTSADAIDTPNTPAAAQPVSTSN
jgi:hypothetical protein